MKKIIFRFLLFFTCTIVGQGVVSRKNANSFVTMDGIVVEQFDSLYTDENKFNLDNIIFKVGSSFKYSYEYMSPANEKYLFRLVYDSWQFVDATKIDSSTVKNVTIKVLNGNPMAIGIPNYSQTNLRYQLDVMKSSTISGVIENKKNVWMHPPRDRFFEILEINPFPYIKAPYEIGNKWEWSLSIGDLWSDGRWMNWNGIIENFYTYEITDKKTILTELGNVECFVVESEAKSRIGRTSLTAYFSPVYGFVRLHYVNIDGSKTNLELIEYQEGD